MQHGRPPISKASGSVERSNGIRHYARVTGRGSFATRRRRPISAANRFAASTFAKSATPCCRLSPTWSWCPAGIPSRSFARFWRAGARAFRCSTVAIPISEGDAPAGVVSRGMQRLGRCFACSRRISRSDGCPVSTCSRTASSPLPSMRHPTRWTTTSLQALRRRFSPRADARRCARSTDAARTISSSCSPAN